VCFSDGLGRNREVARKLVLGYCTRVRGGSSGPRERNLHEFNDLRRDQVDGLEIMEVIPENMGWCYGRKLAASIDSLTQKKLARIYFVRARPWPSFLTDISSGRHT